MKLLLLFCLVGAALAASEDSFVFDDIFSGAEETTKATFETSTESTTVPVDPVPTTNAPVKQPTCESKKTGVEACNHRLRAELCANTSRTDVQWLEFSLVLYVEGCKTARECLMELCPVDLSKIGNTLLDYNVFEARIETTCAKLVKQRKYTLGKYLEVSFRAECVRYQAKDGHGRGGRRPLFRPVVPPHADKCADLRTRLDDLRRKVILGTVQNFFTPFILGGSVIDPVTGKKSSFSFIGNKKKRSADAALLTESELLKKHSKKIDKKLFLRPGKRYSYRCQGAVQPLNWYYASAHVNVTIRPTLMKMRKLDCIDFQADLNYKMGKLAKRFNKTSPRFQLSNYDRFPIDKRIWFILNCYDFEDKKKMMSCKDALQVVGDMMKKGDFASKISKYELGIESISYYLLTGPHKKTQGSSDRTATTFGVVDASADVTSKEWKQVVSRQGSARNELFVEVFPLWGVIAILVIVVLLMAALAGCLHVFECSKR